MISRNWKGVTKREEANNYIAHLKTDTFEVIKLIEGFISASILKRDVENGVEFCIITRWKSMDVIKQFAGENIELAVVPEIAQGMMVSYDRYVTHYEIEHELI